MFPNHINSPFRTPPNSVQQSPNSSSGLQPNIRRLGFFNAVSSTLANQFLNQSGSSSSFVAVDSPESYGLLSVSTSDSYIPLSSPEGTGEGRAGFPAQTPRIPSWLGAATHDFPVQTEGEQRSQLRTELSSWASAAGSPLERADRQEAAVKIIGCFNNKWATLAINSPHITNLPESTGFLGHLQVLDLSNCSAL